MNFLRKFFNYLDRNDERIKQEYVEAYLAKSANIYDLEYRMRELGQKNNAYPF
jgi:Protein of unknown function (DUF3563)